MKTYQCGNRRLVAGSLTEAEMLFRKNGTTGKIKEVGEPVYNPDVLRKEFAEYSVSSANRNKKLRKK